jgi:hypothetical protein
MNRNFPKARSAPPRHRRGVALVITLIMLSIITVVTITILAIVRRDRAASTVAQNLTDARNAADAAQERAKGEMLAQIFRNNALMAFDLTVSRSFPTNLNQLFIDPRVPVFPANMTLYEQTNGWGRFFLDLNRNGFFEDTVLSNNFFAIVGDPQWIGLLDKPYRPHDQNNRFVARYAFIVIPVGKALDLNFAYNMASAMPATPQSPWRYMRNQGFGPWELNVPAFLTDLHPPVWGGPPGYSYPQPGTGLPMPAGIGFAFEDASTFLRYRYAAPDMRNIPSIAALYGANGAAAFYADLIDGYDRGPVAVFGSPMIDNDLQAGQFAGANAPWPGADSTRHYFSHQDLWDPLKTSTNFVDRLSQATANDPYAFYSALAQLGTESEAADLAGKIHLNYVNQVVDLPTLADIQKDARFAQVQGLQVGPGSFLLSPTNFVPWDLASAPELSVQFFTTVAQRLFLQQFRDFNPGWDPNPAISYTNIPSITYIQVAPTNFYTPAVHRLLQEAANIYDATRSNIYPSVFRPMFTSAVVAGSTNVFLVGFTNDNQRSTLDKWYLDSWRYGIPLVVGAKQGYPNFNEYTLETDVQVTRKLQFFRPDTNSAPVRTNQMYILGISNLFAVEGWNSYNKPYPRQLVLDVTNMVYLTITSGSNPVPVYQYLNLQGAQALLPPGFWTGQQFLLPLNRQEIILTNSIYRFLSRTFEPVGRSNIYEPGFPIPDWHLTISNQFRYALTDTDSGSIVDFAMSKDFGTILDIDDTLMQTTPQLGANGTRENPLVAQMWDTNRVGGDTVPSTGIMRQISACVGMLQLPDDVWRSYMDDQARGMDKTKAIATCQRFFNQGQTQYPNVVVDTTSLLLQSPFCPTRKLVKTTTWQADDPLVHYHSGDLLVYPTNSMVEFIVPPTAPVPTNMTLASLGRRNNRYSPWGGNPDVNADPASPTDPNAYDLTIKDAGVRSSDDWDFPSGKFASIGELGRVHRGTPWQTVYFKHIEPEAPYQTWCSQSSEYIWAPNQWYRAHPTNDWTLADLFTIATDPNSTRGLLSINQANIPAWSAVLSGVAILRNLLPDQDLLSIPTNGPIPLMPEIIQPAAIDLSNTPPGIVQVVRAINAVRNAQPTGTFTNLAQFLQVPELTVRSPWLNTASSFQQRLGLTDTAYERLPNQILSLLKVGEPRFVIYAYGQALKPANDSIDSSQNNICTNYQVTAEVATRAVVRVSGFYYVTNAGVITTNLTATLESFNQLKPD